MRACRSDKIKDIYATPRIERGTQVITAEDIFQRQVAKLKKICEPETKLRTYQVLSEVVKRLYESDDVSMTLSAENHPLG